jgi:hypothetical protein
VKRFWTWLHNFGWVDVGHGLQYYPFTGIVRRKKGTK